MKTVGCLGGGQLGRMMCEAGNRIGVKVAILDPGGSASPAGQIAELAIEGSFTEEEKIRQLASVSDILTIEIEHVNTDVLLKLESEGVVIHPNPSTIRIIQDKYEQKQHFSRHNVPLPEYIDVPTLHDAYNAGVKFGYPYMLKNKRLAYDGKGNYVVSNEQCVAIAYEKLSGDTLELYAEKWVPLVKELAVMVVRTYNDTLCYPVVETVQKDNICHVVIAPCKVSQHILSEAEAIAKRAISSFTGIGIYGVELFLLPDDSILLNEIAPRPHNSGHYTMEGCEVDQFEMHLRCVLKLPCPVPKMRVPVACMINVIGSSDSMEETKKPLDIALGVAGVGIHWYGKKDSRIGRKMAHYTVTAESTDELIDRLDQLGIDRKVHMLVKRGPRVGIIMGSDSDLPVMQDAAKILESFGVSYELTIVSAHRTPNRMYTYAQTAVERGIQVIIAGAGGAAHLPGMVAALTSLPVVGVPIKTSTLNGNDSLLSIVQMPAGIPVATVAIGNAINAGLLAIRILASQDQQLLAAMDNYMNRQEEGVLNKAARLEKVGFEAYLNDHSNK